MIEVDREMQKRNLLALAKSPGGFQFSRTFFPYTSFQIGPYYVQSATIMADGEAYSKASEDMAEMVRGVIGDRRDVVVSGGESRDWCFSGPVAQILRLPHTMIYKTDETGQCKVIGANVKGKDVIHVADLSNEGSSPRDMWVPAIRNAGGKITGIFFYVDRLEEGVKVMKELGLNSHAVIPLDEVAWQVLQDEKIVAPEVYASLMARMKMGNDAWAKSMLRSEEGLATLVSLLASSKTRERGQKILSKGYPDIKDEITSMLLQRKSRWPGIQRWLE